MLSARGLWFGVLALTWMMATQNATAKMAGFELGVGAPQLVGPQLKWIAGPWLEVGIGAGWVPVDRFMDERASLEPVDLRLGTPDPVYLDATARFSLRSITPFVRVFPGGSSFFVQGAYSDVRFGAAVDGTVRDQNLGLVYENAAQGKLDFTQSLLTLSVGARPYLTDNVFLCFSIGASFIVGSSYELTMIGDLPPELQAIPGAQDSFDRAKTQVRDEVDRAVSEYRDRFSIYPSASFAVGFSL